MFSMSDPRDSSYLEHYAGYRLQTFSRGSWTAVLGNGGLNKKNHFRCNMLGSLVEGHILLCCTTLVWPCWTEQKPFDLTSRNAWTDNCPIWHPHTHLMGGFYFHLHKLDTYLGTRYPHIPSGSCDSHHLWTPDRQLNLIACLKPYSTILCNFKVHESTFWPQNAWKVPASIL